MGLPTELETRKRKDRLKTCLLPLRMVKGWGQQPKDNPALRKVERIERRQGDGVARTSHLEPLGAPSSRLTGNRFCGLEVQRPCALQRGHLASATLHAGQWFEGEMPASQSFLHMGQLWTTTFRPACRSRAKPELPVVR